MAAIEVINFVSGFPPKADQPSAEKTDFASWLDALPKYYRSGELNFEISGHRMSKNYRNLGTSDVQKLKIIKRIEQKYKNQAAKISKLDGLTMEFPDYWFNLRPSNTEPLLRLNVEAISKKVLDEKIQELKSLVVGRKS